MTFPIRILLGAGALVVSTGAAMAASGTATAALNVRAGPSTGYGVLTTLSPGETVRVLGCSGGWCEVALGGDTGFASSSYLDLDGGTTTRVVIQDYDPGIVAGLSIGGYWEGRPYYIRDGYYFYGGRWYGNRPGRPGWVRSWRRELRQDWRQDRREARQERREDRRDARQERIEDRRDRRDDRAEMRERRENRAETRERRSESRQVRQRAEQRRDQRAGRQEMRRERMSDQRRDRGGRAERRGGGRGDS